MYQKSVRKTFHVIRLEPKLNIYHTCAASNKPKSGPNLVYMCLKIVLEFHPSLIEMSYSAVIYIGVIYIYLHFLQLRVYEEESHLLSN